MKKVLLTLLFVPFLLAPALAAKRQRKVVKAAVNEKSTVKVTDTRSKESRSQLESWIKQMRKRIARSQALKII